MQGHHTHVHFLIIDVILMTTVSVLDKHFENLSENIY